MKKLLIGLTLITSFSSLASSYSSCFCKGEVTIKNIEHESFSTAHNSTETSIYGLYTNSITGEMQEKQITLVGINPSVFGIDNEKCELSLESLRINNVCPKL